MPNRNRVVWIILDAAGYEITRRCLQAGVCKSLAAITEEGYFGPSSTSKPSCQTPPALRALFAGTEPPENGIWGFKMPRYHEKLEESISGFDVKPQGAPTIWDELEQRGQGYTLINAAFRKDQVWGESASHYHFLLDGYRYYQNQLRTLKVGRKETKHSYRGIRIKTLCAGKRIHLKKRGRILGSLYPGEAKRIRLTASIAAIAQPAGRKILCLFPVCQPYCRVADWILDNKAVKIPPFIFHGSLFRFTRENDSLPLEQEMKISELVTSQIGDLALSLIKGLPSRLFIVYFSLLDELSHAYFDQIEDEWPQGRGSELLIRCYALLDSYIGRVMEAADKNTLLVLSSDHGQIPFRSSIHLNRVLSRGGLVKIKKNRYDFKNSIAYYHPSDCGQLVVNWHRAKKKGLSRDHLLKESIDLIESINADYSAKISYIVGKDSAPYLLFLYPQGDTYFTGKGGPGAEIVDSSKKGGHHLSPLCPSLWIRPLLGLWSPAGLPSDNMPMDRIPKHNTGLKDFLLNYLGISAP